MHPKYYLKKARKVPLKQAKEYADSIGAIFSEVSVKSNQGTNTYRSMNLKGIDELFSKLVAAIVKKKPKPLENKRGTISVTEKPKEEPKSSGGCAC